MSLNRDTFIHLFAGGCGGTMGAVVTCPLEVVKTRLQSSTFGIMHNLPPPAAQQRGSTTCTTLPPIHSRGGNTRRLCTSAIKTGTQVVHLSQQLPNPRPHTLSLFHCLKYIVEVEGPRALFRGLGPNLVGVAPSRAIYFCSYSQMKKFLNNHLSSTDTPLVHILSASWAVSTSLTPISNKYDVTRKVIVTSRTNINISKYTLLALLAVPDLHPCCVNEF
ncbi:Solute carrier family 25 member 36 [Penaeus vannamei]|uniref:Solute carrier family 25 member 36 n=1 Tax=Penaeus vannamei TaxID=6689 RepID=A0A3R7M879_PENVA|nr:Solute carrier family 25 member 36 [Penaeus vannamei]